MGWVGNWGSLEMKRVQLGRSEALPTRLSGQTYMPLSPEQSSPYEPDHPCFFTQRGSPLGVANDRGVGYAMNEIYKQPQK